MRWLLLGRSKSVSKGQKLGRPAAPRSIDLVWDQAQSTSEAQERRHAALDDKTIPLLAFGIAFIAFLRETPGTELIEPTVRDELTGLVAIGLLATLGAILPRRWMRVPDLTRFIEDANWDPSRLRERYLRNYATAYRYNEGVLKRKFRWFKLATLMYVVALALGTAFTIWPRA